MADIQNEAAADDAVNTDTIREKLAANIITYRQELKLSRAELAARLGITEAALGQYERAARTPPLAVICRMADVFNTNVDVLIGHDAAGYDAVKEYRFDKAAEFALEHGFFVFESDSGGVKICALKSKDETSPHFKNCEGLIRNVNRNSDKFNTLGEFDSRQSFYEFVENFMSETLLDDEVTRYFADWLISICNDVNYIGDIKFRYDGNAMPF